MWDGARDVRKQSVGHIHTGQPYLSGRSVIITFTTVWNVSHTVSKLLHWLTSLTIVDDSVHRDKSHRSQFFARPFTPFTQFCYPQRLITSFTQINNITHINNKSIISMTQAFASCCKVVGPASGPPTHQHPYPPTM